jgi:hypothetical protein
MRLIFALAGMAIVVSAAEAATAPSALRGYYGKDYAACGADIDLLQITRRRVQTRQVNCKRSDFQGKDRPGQADSFRVRGTTCIPEGETKGHTRHFRIEQAADASIEVFWWDGKTSGKLVKCK